MTSASTQSDAEFGLRKKEVYVKEEKMPDTAGLTGAVNRPGSLLVTG